MTERPILFSAPMVRALLAGTKTQTRRVVKSQPEHPHFAKRHILAADDEGIELFLHSSTMAQAIRCPYGAPGGRLWVRETWAPHFMYEGVRPVDITIDKGSCLFYRADGGITGGCTDSQRARKWRPAIHMPRAASRITLEVTGVRVERLQEISESDARAEGVDLQPRLAGYSKEAGCRWAPQDPREAYCYLWEAINGHGSWSANPWVWVVEFKRWQA